MMRGCYLLLLCLCLAACGVKPKALAPPDGNKMHFPATYPNAEEINK